MYPMEVVHPLLSALAEPEAPRPGPGLVQERWLQVPEQALRAPELVRVPEPLQLEAQLVPEPAQEAPLPFSLVEAAPPEQVSDFPQLPPEREVRVVPQMPLPLPVSPGWQEALQVVNKTQPEETQVPLQSEVSEFVRSCFHLSK